MIQVQSLCYVFGHIDKELFSWCVPPPRCIYGYCRINPLLDCYVLMNHLARIETFYSPVTKHYFILSAIVTHAMYTMYTMYSRKINYCSSGLKVYTCTSGEQQSKCTLSRQKYNQDKFKVFSIFTVINFSLIRP